MQHSPRLIRNAFLALWWCPEVQQGLTLLSLRMWFPMAGLVGFGSDTLAEGALVVSLQTSKPLKSLVSRPQPYSAPLAMPIPPLGTRHSYSFSSAVVCDLGMRELQFWNTLCSCRDARLCDYCCRDRIRNHHGRSNVCQLATLNLPRYVNKAA